MATRDQVVTKPGPNFSLQLVTWTGLLNGDQGGNFEFADWADRAIQIFGTFGAAGTIVIEGSNDGTNFVTLTDAAGSAMSFTAATLKQMTEAPRYIRPRVTGGDGTTSLTVILLARRIASVR
jgi:hypothetical protein